MPEFISEERFARKFGPGIAGAPIQRGRVGEAYDRTKSRAHDVKSAAWWRALRKTQFAEWEYRPRKVKLFERVAFFRSVVHEFVKVTKDDRKVFIRELKAGAAPSVAARAVGKKLKELMSDSMVRSEVDRLIREYSLTAERRRLLVRALANKAALEAAAAEEPDYKALASFLKLIGDDPEVGLGPKAGSAVVGLQVTMSPLVEELHREALAEVDDLRSVPLKMVEAGLVPEKRRLAAAEEKVAEVVVPEEMLEEREG